MSTGLLLFHSSLQLCLSFPFVVCGALGSPAPASRPSLCFVPLAPLAHSLTHLFIHSHPLAHSLVHPPAHSLTQLLSLPCDVCVTVPWSHQLLQAATAVKALAQDGGPMQVAINQIINTAGDIADTVSQLGPGFGLPRRINKVGKAAQNPVYVSPTPCRFGNPYAPSAPSAASVPSL